MRMTRCMSVSINSWRDRPQVSAGLRHKTGVGRGGTHLDQIHLVEGLIAPWLLDIEDADDVLVVEVAQELHLTKSPQAEHGVVKRRDLLDGHLLAGGLVYRGAVELISNGGLVRKGCARMRTYQTTPYAPSPTTSWMSYCSLTLKEILREPAGFGGWARDIVEVVGEAGLASRSNDRSTATSWEVDRGPTQRCQD